MRLALAAAVGLMSLPPLGALAAPREPMILRCDFDSIEEAGQPARHIEVRPGPWDDGRDMFDLFEDGEPVYLWVEEGVPARPVWPPLLDPTTFAMTFQPWGNGEAMDMLTYDTRNGRAVLSTHAAGGNPPHTVASTATGTCAVVRGE
jgi:hypothetical protein